MHVDMYVTRLIPCHPIMPRTYTNVHATVDSRSTYKAVLYALTGCDALVCTCRQTELLAFCMGCHFYLTVTNAWVNYIWNRRWRE
jgi:hypothetical protein